MVLYAAASEAPNWADKLEAWSTFGGAIFTAVAVVVAFLVWRHDRRIRREDMVEAERAQARLVLVDICSLTGSPAEGWTGVKFRVANNSSNQIFQIRIAMRPTGSDIDAPGQNVGGIGAMGNYESTYHLSSPQPWPDGDLEPLLEDPDLILDCVWQFLDSSGRVWSRFNGYDPTPGRHGLD